MSKQELTATQKEVMRDLHNGGKIIYNLNRATIKGGVIVVCKDGFSYKIRNKTFDILKKFKLIYLTDRERSRNIYQSTPAPTGGEKKGR